MSIRTCIFPDEWKRGTVIPLPKINNPKKVGDLRPITLLPIPSKIIEKVIYSQLMRFFENNNFMHENQFGFRKNKSTIDAAFKFVNDIYNNENKKLITSAIFIDYKKAFDSISHEILLKKLKTFYISDQTISWVTSYLSGRQQRTLVNGDMSSWKNISYGVPQGSTLGPLLFLLFVDDVVKIETSSKCIMYADDIVLYCADSTVNSNLNTLKSDMSKVTEWSNMSRLTINFAKTKVMHFGLKAKKVVKPCQADDSVIESVHTYKYLGFLLDQELSFKADLKQSMRIISQKFYMYKKIKQYLNQKAKLDVAKTMLLSYFTYGNIFYGICNDEERSDLQKMQNSILRSALDINNPRDISIVDLHSVTNSLLLDSRRKHQLTAAMHKGVYSKSIALKENVRNLRMFDGLVVRLEHPSTTKYMKTPLYIGGELWNELPADIRNLDDINEFKKHIKDIL